MGDSSRALASSKLSLSTCVTYSGANFIDSSISVSVLHHEDREGHEVTKNTATEAQSHRGTTPTAKPSRRIAAQSRFGGMACGAGRPAPLCGAPPNLLRASVTL